MIAGTADGVAARAAAVTGAAPRATAAGYGIKGTSGGGLREQQVTGATGAATGGQQERRRPVTGSGAGAAAVAGDGGKSGDQ